MRHSGQLHQNRRKLSALSDILGTTCRATDFPDLIFTDVIILPLMAVSASAVRKPAVAGMFYPATANECRNLAQQYVTDGEKMANAVLGNIASSKKLIGGIVPHAGWICSGAVAGETIGAIARSGSQTDGSTDPPVDLVVIFGAVHTPIRLSTAALDSHRSWMEPGGECAVIEEVRAALAEKKDLFVVDDRFHRAEHAVEVELPLIQAAWPTAAILPVEVPAVKEAIEIGMATAKRAIEANRNAVFLASSDLTHYGPNYRFMPGGLGMNGLEWAKQNDRRLLDRVEKFDVDSIVPEVLQHQNACGAGAIAAMLAACREFGANRATVIRQTSSFETLHDVAKQPQGQPSDNSVGYASVVVGL
jgi:hypothetical protein